MLDSTLARIFLFCLTDPSICLVIEITQCLAYIVLKSDGIGLKIGGVLDGHKITCWDLDWDYFNSIDQVEKTLLKSRHLESIIHEQGLSFQVLSYSLISLRGLKCFLYVYGLCFVASIIKCFIFQ